MFDIRMRVKTTDGVRSLETRADDWDEAAATIEGWVAAVMEENIVSIKVKAR